ncbi:MAG: hypothetical protein Q8P60_06720 [Pseudorhodobacter sp.]|nr:hypothetical protein [Pseudorhodobacter sp.]
MLNPIKRTALMAAALVLSTFAAYAGGVATDANGMTLYTFDKDSAGSSTCYDTCAANWPPFLAVAGATMGEGWTQVQRTDGTMQWAFGGKPAYLFVGDAQKGDMSGDGKSGVWHVIKQ